LSSLAAGLTLSLSPGPAPAGEPTPRQIMIAGGAGLTVHLNFGAR
jgi:hypothetical protein